MQLIKQSRINEMIELIAVLRNGRRRINVPSPSKKMQRVSNCGLSSWALWISDLCHFAAKG